MSEARLVGSSKDRRRRAQGIVVVQEAQVTEFQTFVRKRGKELAVAAQASFVQT